MRTAAPLDPLTPLERRTTGALAAVFAMRMLGLFVVLPVIAVYGRELRGETPLLIGLAVGAYGLVQGILQIPFGILSDRFGRKPVIFAGLALFCLGGLVAAASDSIWGVILGRSLQGCGAVSGVVMALLSDLTRESHRTRAMATIGATVGLSFGVAMVLGPLIVDLTGLHGLFLFTAFMALASMGLIALVPTPVGGSPMLAGGSLSRRIRSTLRHPGLFRLNIGIFLLHFVMTAMFLVVPPSLVSYEGLPASMHWKIYLPVILLSLLVMVPVMVIAERRGLLKQALVGATGLLVLSLLVLAGLHRSLWGVVTGMFLYFVAFNLLEALMPSIVSRLSPAGARGTSMGVYSSGQFLGAFAGGVTGGALSAMLSTETILLILAALMLAWMLLALSLRLWSHITDLVLELPASPGDPHALAHRLLGVEGVLEATVVPEDGVAYVRIRGARVDRQKLHDAIG